MTNWIRVEDELPKTEEEGGSVHVLCLFPASRYPFVGRFIKSDEFPLGAFYMFCENRRVLRCNVAHWMAIPRSPNDDPIEFLNDDLIEFLEWKTWN